MSTTLYVELDTTTTIQPTKTDDGLLLITPEGVRTFLLFRSDNVVEDIDRLRKALLQLKERWAPF